MRRQAGRTEARARFTFDYGDHSRNGARRCEMASKSDFTEGEWKVLLQSPLIIGVAILASEPSGFFGMLRESMASAHAIVAARSDPDADALVKAVAADFETSEGRAAARDGLKETVAGADPRQIKDKAIEALRQVRATLEAKAPGDAGAFKLWLAGIARSVAEAASEGGFLGFGAVQVSDAEKATIAEVETALGAPAPSA